MYDLLQPAIDEFLRDCEGRGHSRNTLRAYGLALRDFKRYAEAQGVTALSQVKPGLLRAYGLHCIEILSPGGAHARLRPVKTFLKWSHAEELVQSDLTKRMTLPKLPREEQPAVRPDDFKRLLQAIKLSSRNPQRDTALLTVMFDTGIRASELTGLELDDLKPDGTLIVKRGKGGKSRVVPLERSTARVIRTYIQHERPSNTGFKRIFLAHDEPMTRRTLDKLLARLCKYAALPRLSAHSFRRGFAAQFIRNGGDVFTLQRIFGHTSLEMSNRYAMLDRDDLKSIHRRASPLRRDYDE